MQGLVHEILESLPIALLPPSQKLYVASGLMSYIKPAGALTKLLHATIQAHNSPLLVS